MLSTHLQVPLVVRYSVWFPIPMRFSVRLVLMVSFVP